MFRKRLHDSLWQPQRKVPAPDRIPPEEITLLSARDADPNGKLFRWRGELYGGIYPSRAAFCSRLFDSCLVNRLVERRLLAPAQRAPLRAEGFELVVAHEETPFKTFPFEWCPAMQRDAAMRMLELQEELTREDLCPLDGHNYNLLFAGTIPLFVDLVSIIERPNAGTWCAWDEFCRYNLYPLALASAGEARTTRVLLRDFRNAVPESVAALLCPNLADYCTHRQALAAECDTDGRLRFLDSLRRDIESVPLHRSATEWSEYYGADLGSLDSSPSWRLKQQTFWRVLNVTRPKTLVDIASNRGLYGQIAARYGATVAAFDVDDTAVSDMYADACRMSLPLTPMVMDLLDPSPALGLDNAWFQCTSERLRAEMALASALVHHLVFKMQLSFAQISTVLSRFASRWLLVEFIPREDRYVREWWTEERSWYTLENFIVALRKHFSRVEVLPSDPEPGVFLLCEV